MILRETSKFSKLRKKIKSSAEREALKAAVFAIRDNPLIGKKLKGELEHLRSYPYQAKGQTRRIIYLFEPDQDAITLFSFGPRQGIYK
jgi:mRNA-degrading endonuclease RelE of RelBE toxin-antitoxin system